MIQAALRLGYMEHGELPETLDALEGVYVKQVPLVPFYNKPFEYHPKPGEGNDIAGKELPDGVRLANSSTHVKGTPYLATTLDDSFPTDYALVNNSQTFVYDLTFAREGKGDRN